MEAVVEVGIAMGRETVSPIIHQPTARSPRRRHIYFMRDLSKEDGNLLVYGAVFRQTQDLHRSQGCHWYPLVVVRGRCEGDL